jgi:hypothetical protein
VLGFGTGNLKDNTMEKLADRGNGNYAYVDSLREARKVLVEELAGTLYTIAKDVKIQVEWNPARVGAYRLLGYENRVMPKEDFNDDRKDGGEIGAGHTVTALYEVTPPGPPSARALGNAPAVDPLRYQRPAAAPDAAQPSRELLTLKVRWKAPDGATSQKLEWPLVDAGAGLAAASQDFRFAAAVAAFGMILRASAHRGRADLALVQALAQQGLGADPNGHRRAFLELVRLARRAPESAQAPGELAPRLRIRHEGRPEVAIALDQDRLRGDVRGTPVDVAIERARLEGHIGGEPVLISMRRDEAEGTIGGHKVAFHLHVTPGGHLLRGTGVGHTVRLERSFGTLSWLPACDVPLLPLPRGRAPVTTYQGTCASGRRVQVILPDTWDTVPPLPRMILLGLLLTEKDEILSGRGAELFPAEAKR